MEETTIIGLLLTLVGLLASFFWVSLGTWLRDLVALRSEAAHWEGRDSSEATTARALLRAKVDGLAEFTTGLTTVVVLVFGTFLLVIALILAYDLNGNLACILTLALWVFLVVFFALTIFLLLRGYWLVREVKKHAVEPEFTQ